MDQGAFFDRGPAEEANPAETLPPRIGPKRLRHAVRNQVEFQECSLDELLPEEHEARIVWAYTRVVRGRLPPTRASSWRCGCMPPCAGSAARGN